MKHMDHTMKSASKAKRSLQPMLIGLAALAASVMPARSAEACGGGVGEPASPVSVGGQRAFMSIRDNGTTDIAVQLNVDSSGQFGVLLPLPVEPTVDPTPISSQAFDHLDQQTMPRVGGSEDDFGSGSSGDSGCGSDDMAMAGEDSGGRAENAVTVGSFTDVGPITAVTLTAEDPTALDTWLTENGFSVPAEDQEVIDGYVAQGSWFLAFKRSDGVTTGNSGSIGVHFTLDGDHRDYPLVMARLGAGPEVAITVWISAAETVTPASPFEVITYDALQGAYDSSSYKLAMADAVVERNGRLFVVEYAGERQGPLHQHLAPLADANHSLTRLSTVVKKEHMQQDVSFTGPPAPHVQFEEAGLLPRGKRPIGLLIALAVGAALAMRRQRGVVA